MEFFAHIPPALYITAATILAVVVMRLVADSKRTATIQTVHRLALEKTKRHHQPKLSLLVAAESPHEALATIAAFRAQYSTIDAIALVDSAAQPKLAGQLRYQLKKQKLLGIRVITRKSPQLGDILKDQAKGSLVLAVSEGSRPSRAFYQLAIMPFIDKTCSAVILPRVVRPGNSLASGGEALFWAWRHYLGQIFRRQASPSDVSLATGIIMRRTSLGKPLSPGTVVTASQAAYTTNTHVNLTSVISSTLQHIRHPLLTAVYLAGIAVLVASVITMAQDLLVTLAFVAAAALATWWALQSTASYTVGTAFTLTLLMPFFFVTLLLATLWYGVAAIIRSIRFHNLPLVHRRT